MLISCLPLTNTVVAKMDTGMPEIQFTGIIGDKPVIHLDESIELSISIANSGDGRAEGVIVDVYDVVDGSEMIIDRIHFGAMFPDTEKTKNIDWTPTTLGAHYITVQIDTATEEIPPATFSVGFPVVPLATEEHWRPIPGAGEYSNTISATEGLRTRDGPLEIYVHEGLTIETGATLELNNEITLIIFQENMLPISDIMVQAGATFIINSETIPTIVENGQDIGADQEYYPFINYGTVDFNGAQIWDTDGILEIGGIQNMEGSTCFIHDCELLEAKTTGLTIIGEDTIAQITGEETIIGSLSSTSINSVYHGIYVNEARPIIMDITVQHNEREGIFVENSCSEEMIWAEDLEYYDLEYYDLRVTYDSEPSIQPVVVTEDGVIYMAYLNEFSNEILFKKSLTKGASWTTPMVVGESTSLINNLGEFDLAADGDNVALIWEEWPGFPYMYMKRSSDGGDTWDTNSYEFDMASNPSIEVQGSDIFLAFMDWTWTGAPDFTQHMKFVKITKDGTETNSYLFSNPMNPGGEYSGVPEIAVVDKSVHVVIADYNNGNIDYWFSSSDGGFWSSTGEFITNYDSVNGEMKHGYISLEASFDIVYLAWNSYNSGVGNYQIFGNYAELDGGGWIWQPSDFVISDGTTGDSEYPSVSIDSNDDMYVVWQDDRDGTSMIRYSCPDTTGATVSDICLTPSSPGAFFPCLAIDNIDNAYLVWEDDRDGFSEIYIKKEAQLVIQGTIIDSNDNNFIGIQIGDSEHCKVIQNDFRSNDIYIYLTDNCIIEENIFTDASWTIALCESSGNTISFNTLLNCENGVDLYWECNYNIVSKNTILNNKYTGIYVMGSDSNVISDNFLSGRDDATYDGIHMYWSNDNQIIKNHIYNYDSSGIQIWEGLIGNDFIGNTIMNNGIGVDFHDWGDPSSDNIFYHNNFINNGVSAVDEVGCIWDNGYPSGGNYWSEYTDADIFSGPGQNIPGSDGIWDNPYTFDTPNHDNYPLTAERGYFDIPVILGWNYISVPLVQSDTDLTVVLNDIWGDGATTWKNVKYYDTNDASDPWKTYNVAIPQLADLTDIDHTIGFWAYVDNVGDGYLTVAGSKPASTTINLEVGWTMVGYPAISVSSYTVGDLISDTGATSVEGFDPDNNYYLQVYENDYVMKKGEGYWVYMDYATTWIVDW
ncbi:MAG: right-handed parallel beta-helix repeat-containing protein [Thermoplasmata archaeon]|nr:right-handed parallel beta-helix repeat-containing protein [Thermoplasmata archaeon]